MTNEQINQALRELRELLAAHDAEPTEKNSVLCLAAILKIASAMKSNVAAAERRAILQASQDKFDPRKDRT